MLLLPQLLLLLAVLLLLLLLLSLLLLPLLLLPLLLPLLSTAIIIAAAATAPATTSITTSAAATTTIAQCCCCHYYYSSVLLLPLLLLLSTTAASLAIITVWFATALRRIRRTHRYCAQTAIFQTATQGLAVSSVLLRSSTHPPTHPQSPMLTFRPLPQSLLLLLHRPSVSIFLRFVRPDCNSEGCPKVSSFWDRWGAPFSTEVLLMQVKVGGGGLGSGCLGGCGSGGGGRGRMFHRVTPVRYCSIIYSFVELTQLGVGRWWVKGVGGGRRFWKLGGGGGSL